MDHPPRQPLSGELPLGSDPIREVAVSGSGWQASTDADPGAELHVCPECSSELVHPVEWGPVDARRWRVELRCPECEWRHAGLYEQSALDRFDQVLDAGTDQMVVDLRRLQRNNMEEELRRFGMALSRDLILPEDF